MTSKSDSSGHPGLKLCVHVSVMGCYRFTNFRQNRRGSGSKWHFFGRFHMEWPISQLSTGWVILTRSHIPPVRVFPEYRSQGEGWTNRAADLRGRVRKPAIKLIIMHETTEWRKPTGDRSLRLRYNFDRQILNGFHFISCAGYYRWEGVAVTNIAVTETEINDFTMSVV